MNKADEKALKQHPRYAAIVAEYARMEDRIAAAQREIDAAKRAFQMAAPELYHAPRHRSDGLDGRLFEALRPRGDKVRVTQLGLTGRALTATEAEIENVTATQVSLVGHNKPFRGGYLRTYGSPCYRIHEDDLARIQAGELKGWRQRPWAR